MKGKKKVILVMGLKHALEMGLHGFVPANVCFLLIGPYKLLGYEITNGRAELI